MKATLKIVSVLAVVVLSVGLAACGSSDSTSTPSTSGGSSTSTTATAQAKQRQGAQKAQDKGSPKETQRSEVKEANTFTPKHHTDSGGGSKQLKVKGGDNSVQEFGEEADTSQLDAAATVLHNFLDARAEGNWAAVCQYMSKPTIESFEKVAVQATQIEARGCGGILAGITNPAAKPELKAEAEKADVRSLRIEGGRAFVIYTSIEGNNILAMPMANEGGSWKVASLAGTPIN